MMSALGKVGVAAAVEFVAAAVEGDVLVPCNAVPTPSWRLEDFRLPFLQTPLESCRVGYLPLGTSSACPALFSFALTVMIPAVSSLLLASACLLRLLHAASSSLILPRLAIAVEDQAAVPWADLIETDSIEADLIEVDLILVG